MEPHPSFFPNDREQEKCEYSLFLNASATGEHNPSNEERKKKKKKIPPVKMNINKRCNGHLISNNDQSFISKLNKK
jgi:hypothetical protein